MNGFILALSLFTATQVPQSEPVTTPASVMADQVRLALAQPGAETDWTELEGSGQQLTESLRSDVRVGVTGGSETSIESVQGRESEAPRSVGPQMIVSTLILTATLALVGHLVVRWMRGRASAPSGPAIGRVAMETSGARAWTATVLSSQGMTGSEIARKTGLARDAVSLALHENRGAVDPHRRSVA